MKKLQIFICENFYPEYKRAIQIEEFEDVDLHVFPSLCDSKARKKEVKKILAQVNKKQSVLICSKSCDALNLINDDSQIRVTTGNYCFSHLTSDEFLSYLITQGSYIVSSGWLKNWKRHINVMGFDKETAKNFFQESNNKLIFLDAKIDKNSETLLKDLSSYVGLPYQIVPIELEEIRLMLKSLVYEWRLHNQKQESETTINEMRNQFAEYSAIFDMLGKISTYSTKRDVIGKIKELFLMIFGAENFKFWNDQSDSLPEEIEDFKLSENLYLLQREKNRFCIKISWEGILYGIVDASGFMFSQHIDKYLNLAMEIAKVSGLVFHNNEQYEKILESEKELKHLSFHDSMTGLYNRTYINQILSDNVNDSKIIVFMFDIDELKYVNDNYGHSEGDKLIKNFAIIMKKSFRETDIVARIGGDEFMAILYNAGEEIAKSIRERIMDMIKVNNENLKINYLKLSVSIGYAMHDNENDTIERLMKKADKLMYDDKMNKRNNNN